MQNEQQFQILFTDNTTKTVGADTYRIEDAVLTFYERLDEDEQPVASFPMDSLFHVIRVEPAVEYEE